MTMDTTPPSEFIFQIIESGLNGETSKTLFMGKSVLNMHYVMQIIRLHMTSSQPSSDKRSFKVRPNRKSPTLAHAVRYLWQP